MMTTSLDWLASICAEDGGLEISRAPMTVEHDGTTYAFACDGRLAVLIDGEHGFPKPEKDRTREQAGRILGIAWRPIGKTTVDAIRCWSGSYEPAQMVECDYCRGSAHHKCDCEHEHDCGWCDGTGQVEQSAERRAGKVGDVLLDRNLTAKAMQHLAGSVEVCVGKEAKKTGTTIIAFQGAGWRVLQACLEKSESEAPTLELEVPS